MSKFNESNMKDYNIMKADNFKPCVECGEMTQYMDYIYECRMCSEECLEKTNEELMRDMYKEEN